MNNKSKLIIINGATGVGKSTLASRLHQEIPMSFLIEMDAIRRYFSHYKEMRKESLFANYDLTKAISEHNLRQGHSVIIEKVIPDNDEFIDELIQIGLKNNAETHEIILHASKGVIVKRAELRGYSEDNSLTPEKVLKFWTGIEELIPRRPDAFVVNTDTLNSEELFDLIMKKHLL